MEITINGIPAINTGINYTKKGKSVKPVKCSANEKLLRAGIINSIPVGFKPFSGPVAIEKLEIIFPAIPKLRKNSTCTICEEEVLYHTCRPCLTECLKDIFNAMNGTLIYSPNQIFKISGLIKKKGGNPGITIALEEENANKKFNL